MFKDIVTSYFGPYKNHWGYVTELAVIDDLMILKIHTPYQTIDVNYYFDEESVTEKIRLINQDRRF